MRTLSDYPQLIVERVMEHDTPSADIVLPRAVRPQSLDVSVNGMRLHRSMVSYDAERNRITVPWVLFAGDTVTCRATPA